MNDERNDLLIEANELGLDFPSNIKTTKLKAMISEAKGEPPAVDEIAPKSPAAKPEAESEETEKEISDSKPTTMSKFEAKRKKVADSKERAYKTQIVTITNKDNRENDIMTTVYLSFENQYFGLSKVVPLDVPVQLENSLIKIAESTMMTLHKDEIKNGKRTGNKIPTRVKKFAISYSKQ